MNNFMRCRVGGNNSVGRIARAKRYGRRKANGQKGKLEGSRMMWVVHVARMEVNIFPQTADVRKQAGKVKTTAKMGRI